MPACSCGDLNRHSIARRVTLDDAIVEAWSDAPRLTVNGAPLDRVRRGGAAEEAERAAVNEVLAIVEVMEANELPGLYRTTLDLTIQRTPRC